MSRDSRRCLDSVLGVAVVGIVELDVAIFYGVLEIVGTGVASVDHLEVVLPFVNAGHGYFFSFFWVDEIDGDCSWVSGAIVGFVERVIWHAVPMVVVGHPFLTAAVL